MTEWELIDDLLRRSGWPDAETVHAAGGWSIEPEFRKAHHLDGFPTPDGRFRFKPDWASLGAGGHLMPRLPDHMPAGDEPTPGQALPHGGGTLAPVPELDLHRDADLA